MGPRFMNMSTFVSEQDDSENSPENSADSPRFAMLNDSKLACTSSPKKSRRSIQKRVISVPIKDLEGSRLKGEMGGAPPSDSWSWRKYGQKPIKGSPYPRGYYRCSSSKGCPARKQVERSMLDPTKLMVTYSCEHNHPWPAPRNHNHNVATRKTPIIIQTEPTNSGEEYEEQEQKPTINITQKSTELIINNISHDDQKIGNLGGEATTLISDYGYTNNYWLSDFECTTSTTMFESPLMSEARVTDADMAMVFTMRDDDESFFADLGELPECSTVFRREIMEREEEHHRRHNLAPWCGTT